MLVVVNHSCCCWKSLPALATPPLLEPGILTGWTQPVQHGTARDLLVPGLKREERRDTLSVSTFTCVGAVRNVRKMELSSGR